DRVQEVDLPADDGVPMRRVRFFLIVEPNLRTRVEGVDGHASIRGAGDLHPAIRQPGRGWGDSPRVVGADVFGLGEEVQGASGRELGLTSAPRGKRFLAATFEGPVELNDELKCAIVDYFFRTLGQFSVDLHAAHSHESHVQSY